MKKTKLLLCVVSCIALLMTLCSCSAEKKLVGKWVAEEESFFSDTIEFFSDGTYVTEIGIFNGDYTVDGNRIKFGGILYSKVGTFKVSRNKLVIKNDAGGVATYRRAGTNGSGGVLNVDWNPREYGIRSATKRGIFTNWWTFEHFAQIIIVLIVFVISWVETQKIRKAKMKKEAQVNGIFIGRFTKKFLYAELVSLTLCVLLNLGMYMAAHIGYSFYWPGISGLFFWILLGFSIGLIGGTYYLGELNKSIEYAYLYIEDGKVIARNPEMCGFSVKLSTIDSAEIMRYKPKKMPLLYKLLLSDNYKLVINANNTVYEACGIENINEIKLEMDRRIAEAKQREKIASAEMHLTEKADK